NVVRDFIRKDIVAVLWHSRLEDVIREADGLRQRVRKLKLHPLVQILARAHLQAAVVADVGGLETREQSQRRVEQSARIQFPAHPAMDSQNMHVAGIQHNAPRQLLSYAKRPLLGVRLTHVAVHGETSGRWQGNLKGWIVHVRLRREKYIDEVFHSVERAIDVADFPHGRIVVDTETAPQHCLAVPAQVVGEAHAWPEAQFWILARSAIKERRQPLQWLFEAGIDEAALEFVAQAEIQRQLAVHFPV